MIYLLIISLCFIIACLITPYVMKLAYFTNAVDQPNKRKVHSRIMPTGDLCCFSIRLHDF